MPDWGQLGVTAANVVIVFAFLGYLKLRDNSLKDVLEKVKATLEEIRQLVKDLEH